MKSSNKGLIIGISLAIIVILVVGILIFIAIKGARLSDEEIEAFNQPFSEYEGRKIGRDVSKLLEQIVESNQAEENANKQIKLNADTIKDSNGNMLILGEQDGRNIELRNAKVIGSNKFYIISFEYGMNGLINVINITT